MRTFIIQNREHTLLVPKVIFGTTYLGNIENRAEAFAQLDEYYEQGGRCIDTARCYSNLVPEDRTPSEEVIGEWLSKRERRGQMLLSTKGGHPPYGKMDLSRLDAGSLRYDLEQSLKALQTDYIDIYWLHRDDRRTPVSEIIGTLNEFVREGKIRCFGASNWQSDRIYAANRFANNQGFIGFSAGQVQWSLASCTPSAYGDETVVCMDRELYQAYFDFDFPVMAYNSQAKGFFSKLAAGRKEAELPEKIRKRYLNAGNREENLKRYERVRELSEKYHVTPAVIALAYLTCNRLKCGAVIGCSSREQIVDSMQAQDFVLPDEEVLYLEG